MGRRAAQKRGLRTVFKKEKNKPLQSLRKNGTTYSCCSTAPHSIPHVQQEHFRPYQCPSHPHCETHREPLMIEPSIPCFLLFQNFGHVVVVDEKLERLELHQKTPQHPVNCQPYFSPPKKKFKYSTDTISGSLHVVRGRYEASHICSDR